MVDILADRQGNTRRLINREATFGHTHAVPFGGDKSGRSEYTLTVCLDSASYTLGVVGYNHTSARYCSFRRILDNTGNTPETCAGLSECAAYQNPRPND